MSNKETILRFRDVSFKYDNGKKILEDASFGMQKGLKFALMGQNGAGKSTIFKLITKELQPISGSINLEQGATVARSKQIMQKEDLNLTVKDFFAKYFTGEDYELKKEINEVLGVVNLKSPLDKKVNSFSGGQQARLLLASALIQNPDLLLLDEPTNNLDADGIGYLMSFLMMYDKSCIVISHDADFLNTFTDGVIYLDKNTHTIDQYKGDYYTVIEEISNRIEKEKRKNAQLEKKIRENKEKINYFQNKGGKMRLLAKKLKDEVKEMEESRVEVKKEDKPIKDFTIPAQKDLSGNIITINSVTILKDGEPTNKKIELFLRKNDKLLIKGPNGIGKTTLLEKIASNNFDGELEKDVKIGYYRQDFSTLNFDDTVYNALMQVMKKEEEEYMRRVAAGFMINKEIINSKIGDLSEGQKGLVAFAQLVLMEPGLLILDEPTNHINFRHIPVIAKAIDAFDGAIILVSHVDSFVESIQINKELDLNKI